MSVDITENKHHDHINEHRYEASSTGNYLQRVRLSKNISEAEISQVLKIKPRIIHAIENHHYDCLPDTTSVSALVRQYAQFLGLNGVEIARNYKNEINGIGQKIDVTFPEKLPSSFKPVKKTFIVILCLLCAFGIWNFLGARDNLLPKMNTSKKIVHLTPLSDTINKPVSGSGNRKYTLEIVPFVHFTVIKKPEIIIHAKGGEAWIEIKNSENKQIIFSGILKDNASYTVPNALSGLILKAGNSAPLSISVNGQILDNILPKSSRVLRNFSLNPEELLKLSKDNQATTTDNPSVSSNPSAASVSPATKSTKLRP
jgi:hypothetical protein